MSILENFIEEVGRETKKERSKGRLTANQIKKQLTKSWGSLVYDPQCLCREASGFQMRIDFLSLSCSPRYLNSHDNNRQQTLWFQRFLNHISLANQIRFQCWRPYQPRSPVDPLNRFWLKHSSALSTVSRAVNVYPCETIAILWNTFQMVGASGT